ncbi:2,3-diaminopropionate biosynthesis protein SbnB [Massilia sp. erpn]|uniref:2,3-diaminopropionate biosynthesis protein SbnB n=1 Tax=Massilia sp. erpn TaxID=2738142 RepID=UPI0021048DE3|nr:2,3-diaminopropionate biosynthesis protein SbnB [Massilia sp. erpn]UTY58939.1 2,3-diaminopropionate biosynthesis protein SbnB [Massilia sp. erpn]
MFEFHVIPGARVRQILDDHLAGMAERVGQAYLRHHAGQTINPDSYFLRFPSEPRNRIIALPGAIEGADGVAGIKWISSFPANTEQGLPRASAVIVLNDRRTGYPIACMEGAQISAVRTAASAVLGAWWMNGRQRHCASVSFIGAGVIARNIARMLRVERWAIGQAIVHDADPASADALQAWLRRQDFPAVQGGSLEQALQADLVVFATTAGEPYVQPPFHFRPGQIVLNISLRDIAPELILAAENICDDVEHCMKAGTSPHLAEQLSGTRAFMKGSLAALMRGEFELDRSRPLIFSPFGLGVLDLELARLVLAEARQAPDTVAIEHFFAEEARW